MYFYLVFIGPYRNSYSHILYAHREAQEIMTKISVRVCLQQNSHCHPWSLLGIPLIVMGTHPEIEDCATYCSSHSYTWYSHRAWRICHQFFFSVLTSHEITPAEERKQAHALFESRFTIPTCIRKINTWISTYTRSTWDQAK